MENAQLNGHELRYALTPGDYQAIRGRLLAAGTAETERGGGWVHTLGFASYINKALPGRDREERMESCFSLRYYNNDPTFLMLERREGRTTSTAMVTEAECRALLAGETDWLAERHDPVLRDFHTGLTERMLLPRLLLFYHRESYSLLEDYGIWVALDTDISVSLQHEDFLDPELLAREAVAQTGRSLLEISYTDTIPDRFLCLLEEAAPRRQMLVDRYL